MIIYGIKLAAFSAFAILSTMVYSRSIFLSGLGLRIIGFWLVALPLVFVVKVELFTLWVSLIFLFLCVKNQKNDAITVAFFIGVLAAVPGWLEYRVSLPGINYLLTLSFFKVAVIALLFPVLFRMKNGGRVKWHVSDAMVCMFVLLTTLLALREGKLTSLLRLFMDSSLIYLIPYFVVSRTLQKIEDFHYCSVALYIFAIVLASILMVSQIIQLDLYEVFNPNSQYIYLREYRGGFLRLFGPVTSTMIGVVMLAGYLSLESLKKYDLMSAPFYWLSLVLFIFALLFSGSRGALFSFMLGASIYWYFIKISAEKRVILAVIVIAILIAELLFNISSAVFYNDEYGTFDYRVELYSTSWKFLQQFPLFGHQFYLRTGYFNHLVTGLGIVDIVSAYLQVALRYGFVGLLVFIGMYLSVVIPLGLRLFRLSEYSAMLSSYIAMYFAMNVSLMFMILTTSMISLVPIFMVVNLALGRAVIAKVQRAEAAV